MALYQIIILAIIQGLTEFLPISSSGHLIIMPVFLKWPDQGLAMDVAMHIGTLGAVLLYFRRDVWKMLKGSFTLIQGRLDPGGKLALFLAIGTIPAVLFGTLISAYGPGALRTVAFVGWTTLLFGLLLHIVDSLSPQSKTIKQMSAFHALMVGLAQAVALLPGTSRSGICMTMSRFLGFRRQDSARFAFLLSIPAIIAAGTHTAFKMHKAHHSFLQQDMLVAAAIAFVVGLMAINFMLKWLQRSDFKPFVIYRLVLGSILLLYAYL